MTKITILLLALFFFSCENMFDYSPYVIDFDNENKNINQKNIDKLQETKADNTIRIAFTGDTHRFFDKFDNFVNAANQDNSIDFVIHVGDISDFGLPQQYIWGNSYLLNLNFPYFVVLGNHDMVGNGGLAYHEMYGEFNFSFLYGQTKFIFINTNSREFNFNGKIPDINWLDSQLQPNSDFENAVVVFHVPPNDADFDSSLNEEFQATLAKYNNLIFAVHGHLHGHNIYTLNSENVNYVNVYSAGYEKFNIINITNGTFDVESYEF